MNHNTCQKDDCSRLYNPRSGRHFPAYVPLCGKHRIGYRAGDVWQCVKCEKYVSTANHSCAGSTVDQSTDQISTGNSVQKNQASVSEDTRRPCEIEESLVFHDYCQEEGCNRLYRSDSAFPLCEEHIEDHYWAGKIWRCIECNRYVDRIDHTCSNGSAQVGQSAPRFPGKRQTEVQKPNLKDLQGMTVPTQLSDRGVVENDPISPPEDKMSPCELGGCTHLKNNSSDIIAPLCGAHLFDYRVEENPPM